MLKHETVMNTRSYEIVPVLTECAACYAAILMKNGEIVDEGGDPRPFYQRSDAVERGEHWVETAEF